MSSNDNVTDKFSQEYRELHIRPWIRFFARYTDIYIFSLIMGIISVIFFPSLFTSNYIANRLIIIFLWCLFEPIFLCSLGTTFGKFLFNIKLTDLNGKKLKIFDAYKRSFEVWIMGLGFGVPFISLFTLVSAYSRLNRTGTTWWDQNKFIVTHKKVGFIKGTIAFLIGISLLLIPVYENSHKYHASTPNHALEKENKKLPTHGG